MNNNNITPFVATHPGEMIKDELQARKMTQKQLAALTGIQPSVLSETINGKRPLSLNNAMLLQKALGIPAEVWMNLQSQYDIDQANIEQRANDRETVTLTIPIKDRGLLKDLARKFNWACMF